MPVRDISHAVRWLARLSSFLWIASFVALVLMSLVSKRDPSSRWLAVWGVLIIVLGVDLVVNVRFHCDKWQERQRFLPHQEFYAHFDGRTFMSNLGLVVICLGTLM